MTNPDHFKKYLGKENHYHDFLLFWQNEIEEKGWEIVLNEYVFAGDERADDMLTRMYAGKPQDNRFDIMMLILQVSYIRSSILVLGSSSINPQS